MQLHTVVCTFFLNLAFSEPLLKKSLVQTLQYLCQALWGAVRLLPESGDQPGAFRIKKLKKLAISVLTTLYGAAVSNLPTLESSFTDVQLGAGGAAAPRGR